MKFNIKKMRNNLYRKVYRINKLQLKFNHKHIDIYLPFIGVLN